MRKLAAYCLLAALILPGIVGCERKAVVIPAGKMSQIYFDMLLVDRWIRQNSDVMEEADTTLVYEPIFREYGYSTKDYNKSLDYYIEHPEEYQKIITNTIGMFKSEIDRVEGLLEINRSMLRSNYESVDFTRDSTLWNFLKDKELKDSIIVHDKWLILQENTDTLPIPRRRLRKEQIFSRIN